MNDVSNEIEIKLALPENLTPIRRTLRDLGFGVSKKRVHELNVVFDTAESSLRKAGKLIRIRKVAAHSVLTYKGPPKPGRHKSREELETGIPDPVTFEKVLSRLGFNPTFRYEKFRTEYERTGERGVVTLDETPIGNFLELEGPPRWIDRTAKALEFAPRDYITKSYGSLYLDYSAARGTPATDMLFRHRGKARRA